MTQTMSGFLWLIVHVLIVVVVVLVVILVVIMAVVAYRQAYCDNSIQMCTLSNSISTI